MNAAGELTLADLLLTLGERVGQFDRGTGADNRSVAPTDPATRDRLLRAINAGRREVYSRMPDARCFQPRISFTTDPTGTAANVVGADAGKYRLPYAVQGGAGGQFSWSDPASAGYGRNLTQMHATDIAQMYATAAATMLTTFPYALAIAREILNNPNEPGRRTCSYVWIFPRPDKAYIIEGQVRVQYEPLVSPDDLEPMGQQHAETILAFAERDWMLGRRDQADAQMMEARCDRAIAISIELDNVSGPQTIGIGVDPDAINDSRKYRIGRYYPDRAAMVDNVSGFPTGI